jgi:hypothetical protein
MSVIYITILLQPVENMQRLSPRTRRCRQRNSKRITTQHHEGDQPADGPLRIRVRAEQFGNVPDGRRLCFGLPSFSSHTGAFSLEGRQEIRSPQRAPRELCAGSRLPPGRYQSCRARAQSRLATPLVPEGNLVRIWHGQAKERLVGQAHLMRVNA